MTVTDELRLAAAYRLCADITRAHGTTYHWGTLLLPPERRHHVEGTTGGLPDRHRGGDDPGIGGPTGTGPRGRAWSTFHAAQGSHPATPPRPAAMSSRGRRVASVSRR